MTNLNEDDSAAYMLDAAERHARLCRQTPKGAKYEISLLPMYNELKAKNEARLLAEKDGKTMLDIVRLNNMVIGDILHKLHNRSQEYDKENPGAKTCIQLFPDGKLTAVTSQSYENVAKSAAVMAQKIEAWGSSHALYPLVSEINAQVSVCENGFKARTESGKAEDAAWGSEDMAKMALMKQYSDNYHTAVTEYDKNFAEKLFPNLKRIDKKDGTSNGSITVATK